MSQIKNAPIPENCLIIDSGLGFFPAIASIINHNSSKDSNEFDFTFLIIQLRQLMTKLQCYDQNQDKLIVILNNLKKPEKLLFHKIKLNYLPKEITERTFEPLICKKLISDYRIPDSENKSYAIIFNRQEKENSFNQLIVQEFNRILLLPNTIPQSPYIIKNNSIENPQFAIEKFALTPKIKETFDSINVSKYILKKTPQLEEKIKKYELDFLMPLVAGLDKHPDQTVIYFMVHYKLKQNITLDMANIELTHLLPSIFETHPEIFSLVKECRDCCKTFVSHDCIIKKLLTRPPNSLEICAVFFITFSSEAATSKQHHLPIKQLYDHIKNNLRIWDVYMKGYTKFPI